VIRWITQNLGTASASNLTTIDDVFVLDVRDLVDKNGNSVSNIKEKIEKGLHHLQHGSRVVVCCDYGISRSNAIAAGILARHISVSFDQAIELVMRATGEQEIKLDPLRSVRIALDEEECLQTGESSPRILVTGGNGFVGRALVRQLAQSYYTIAPPRGDLDLTAGSVTLDLLVRRHRINHIVHLANPHVLTTIGAVGETLTLLRNVLEVCKENRVRLIYPSGWEVYSGYRTSNLFANEALPLLPKGPYGETKLLCENLIQHHRQVHGLECGLLRSSPLYGDHGDRPRFIYNFISKALRNEQITTHRYLNGEPRLDLLHIEDFVRAVTAVIEANFVGALNLGSGRAVGTMEIAEWIVRQTGSSSTVESKEIDDYAANITMDFSSAMKLVSWQPATSWETGLRQLLAVTIGPPSKDRG